MTTQTNLMKSLTRRFVVGAAVAFMGLTSSNAAFSADLDYAFKNGGNEANRAAVRLLKRGNARDAANILQAIINKGGRKALVKIAQTNLCAAQSLLGNQEAALSACDTALEMDAVYFEALVNRGNVYFAQGERAKALKDFRTAETIKPGKKIVTQAIAALEKDISGTMTAAGAQ